MPHDRPRHILNNATKLLKVAEPRAELLKSLTKLVTECPPAKPWGKKFLDGRHAGLFTGPTSVAFIFYYITRVFPDLQISGHAPSEWCAKYLACADPPRSASLESEGCGITNEFLAFHTVSAIFLAQESHARLVIDGLRDAHHVDPTLCEWMRGRAGALYLLRLVSKSFPTLQDELKPVSIALIQQILAARPWTFRDKRYIGAVHGDIGIITQAVLTDPTCAPDFEEDLEALLELQLKDGNWPSRADDGSSLVQFCHGAPGFIFSLLPLRQHFPSLEKRIDAAIARGRQCTWEQGLLTKEPSLCHGSTGNALALEKEQMEHFMAESTDERVAEGVREGIYEMSYDAWGLLWGEAGRAWSWAVYASDPQEKGSRLEGVISYTDV
jgi:Lanthionine synthetase C-like protein